MFKRKELKNWNKVEVNKDGNSIFLPNPDVIRKPCEPECEGCEKVYIGSEVPLPVCVAYEDPKIKWKNHTSEMGEVIRNRKKVKVKLHYNPCALATHATHTVIEKGIEKHREGQQKQKK